MNPSLDHPSALQERIRESILTIRGRRVILDFDLARLYRISTKALNQAAKRNQERFPDDFAFRLSVIEKAEVVTNCDHLRGLRYSAQLPAAYTEHGALMAANIVSSPRAVLVSLYVVRAFVSLRRRIGNRRQISDALSVLESKMQGRDVEIKAILGTLRELIRGI